MSVTHFCLLSSAPPSGPPQEHLVLGTRPCILLEASACTSGLAPSSSLVCPLYSVFLLQSCLSPLVCVPPLVWSLFSGLASLLWSLSLLWSGLSPLVWSLSSGLVSLLWSGLTPLVCVPPLVWPHSSGLVSLLWSGLTPLVWPHSSGLCPSRSFSPSWPELLSQTQIWSCCSPAKKPHRPQPWRTRLGSLLTRIHPPYGHLPYQPGPSLTTTHKHLPIPTGFRQGAHSMVCPERSLLTPVVWCNYE